MSPYSDFILRRQRRLHHWRFSSTDRSRPQGTPTVGFNELSIDSQRVPIKQVIDYTDVGTERCSKPRPQDAPQAESILGTLSEPVPEHENEERRSALNRQ